MNKSRQNSLASSASGSSNGSPSATPSSSQTSLVDANKQQSSSSTSSRGNFLFGGSKSNNSSTPPSQAGQNAVPSSPTPKVVISPESVSDKVCFCRYANIPCIDLYEQTTMPQDPLPHPSATLHHPVPGGPLQGTPPKPGPVNKLRAGTSSPGSPGSPASGGLGSPTGGIKDTIPIAKTPRKQRSSRFHVTERVEIHRLPGFLGRSS